jgi:hypothetical protein
VYYQLYANDEIDMSSKVAFDPDEPSLGRIRADSVAPPHSPSSIKRCISRVEKTAALVHANLFADISCDTPLKEGHISILSTDGPGLSPNEPMAIVQMHIVQMPVENPSIPLADGRYLIKNRTADIFWSVGDSPIEIICFFPCEMERAMSPTYKFLQVNEHFSISQVHRITLFQSGTSHMIPMVTSS